MEYRDEAFVIRANLSKGSVCLLLREPSAKAPQEMLRSVHCLPNTLTSITRSTTLEAATDKAAASLIEHIPIGSTVTDIGCGWGGTLAMLGKARNATVTGVTISRTQ